MQTKLVKSSLVVLALMLVVCGFQLQAYAMEVGRGPIQKLGRGIIYLVASPFQIPKEIIQKAAEADPIYLAAWKGFAEGTGSGLYQAGRQGVAGFWDLFTFYTPAGRDWGPL
ncbi:MAG: hypothetical protein HY588_01170, partial [Candidatus Omnitrophica bacterium]|nr:hypothetical protein [Candidatus Omnitrophota bacterium]